MATGCQRKIEKINICIKLTKNDVLVTDENMGLCLYIYDRVIYDLCVPWQQKVKVILKSRQ